MDGGKSRHGDIGSCTGDDEMKKRLLLVNPVCGILSTGRICTDIAKQYEAEGWEVKIAYGRNGEVPAQYKKYGVRIGNVVEVYIHALISRIFGYHATGWCSKSGTKRFVKWAEEWNPDLVWLHNLHDNYVNVEVLFKWIKSRPNMQVKWTHHDFWAMTGCCTYLNRGECGGWRNGCENCQWRQRRAGMFGGSQRREFLRKKESFLGVKNMQMISPSKWVADLLKQSFLGCYPVEVIHNTIDLSVFKHRESDFRKRYGLEDKKIILGVSGFWNSKNKGIEDFIALSDMLDDRYAIVLVGVDKKTKKRLPGRIIALERTNSAVELAEIYSVADVFFNPTKLDNFPTVNLEARACGCPIVTYDSGGCAETVEGYENAIVLKDENKTPKAAVRAIETALNR